MMEIVWNGTLERQRIAQGQREAPPLRPALPPSCKRAHQILAMMRAQPRRWFTYVEIAARAGLSEQAIRKAMEDLFKAEAVERKTQPLVGHGGMRTWLRAKDRAGAGGE